MTNLQILSVEGNCGINDEGIKNLNLIKLNANCNSIITNINHMTNLQILQACDCGINNEGIKNLNLIELYAYGNNNITHINHMTNLKIYLW
jgi:hypothetical protein